MPKRSWNAPTEVVRQLGQVTRPVLSRAPTGKCLLSVVDNPAPDCQFARELDWIADMYLRFETVGNHLARAAARAGTGRPLASER